MAQMTLTAALTYLQDYNREATSARDVRICTKIANDANEEFHRMGLFDFDRRWGRLAFAAQKTAGTVSINAGASAVTGVGTAFASADVGGFIRFAGEEETYPVATYVSPTSITITGTYLMAANLSAGTYSLTNPRVALPARFRQFQKPQSDVVDTPMSPCLLSQIMYWRKFIQETGNPRDYAVEWSSTPAPFIWVYPDPLIKTVVDIFYYVHPTPVSAGTDLFGIPEECDGALRQLMRAHLYAEQGKPEAAVELERARQQCFEVAGAFRSISESPQREMWTPSSDLDAENVYRTSLDNVLAAGEPLYI